MLIVGYRQHISCDAPWYHMWITVSLDPGRQPTMSGRTGNQYVKLPILRLHNVPADLIIYLIHKLHFFLFVCFCFNFRLIGWEVLSLVNEHKTYLFVFCIQISLHPAPEWSVWSKCSSPLWKKKEKNMLLKDHYLFIFFSSWHMIWQLQVMPNMLANSFLFTH